MLPQNDRSVTPFNSQLSLTFDDHDSSDMPLPELISHGGDTWQAFPLQCHDVDGVRFYAIQDWLRGVAHTDNPRVFWAVMKRRFTKAGTELFTWCVQLKYRATDGKNYKVDFADAETLYKITQRMDTTTGIRNKVLDYLAKAGVKLDEYRLDPGKGLTELADHARAKGRSQEWIDARTRGKAARNQLTDAARDTHSNHDPKYAVLTAKEYEETLLRTKAEIVKELGLTKAQATHFRDYLHDLALQALKAIESAAGMKMRQLRRPLEDYEQIEIVVHVARMLAPAFRETAQYLGIDLATGKNLLR